MAKKSAPPRNKLLVEGDEDKRVIPYLIEANDIPWIENQQEVVFIKEYAGKTKLLKKDVIYSQLKSSGLSALGLMVDADNEPENTWQSIRNVCLPSIPNFPENLP